MRTSTAPTLPRFWVVLIVMALIAALGLGTWWLADHRNPSTTSVVSSDTPDPIEPVILDGSQREIAKIITSVGQDEGATPMTIRAALIAGWAESHLTDLAPGDSVTPPASGVFQVLVTVEGGGTVEDQARSFYNRAARCESFPTPATLAQCAQRSAFPGAYQRADDTLPLAAY